MIFRRSMMVFTAQQLVVFTSWCLLMSSSQAWLVPSHVALSRKKQYLARTSFYFSAVNDDLTTGSSSEPDHKQLVSTDDDSSASNMDLTEERRSLLSPDQEEKYAVADGAYLEKFNNNNHRNDDDDDSTAESATSATSSSSNQESTVSTTAPATDNSPRRSSSNLADTMERLTKPRAYPLFLAEKAAEFLESSIDNVLGIESLAQTLTGNSNDFVKKERIVVLGTGFGAVSFLQNINTNNYQVTVVSPRNHFAFTPLLAGACVGSVSFRSTCEPIREINPQASFVQAAAVHINPQRKTVQCRPVSRIHHSINTLDNDDDSDDVFLLEYDRLVVTVGAQTNTFGIPGVREHCYFLRQVEDARRIRSAIFNRFETASALSQWTDDAQRQDYLTFCVIGAGPTGIEFASELRDFVEQDGPRYYPNLLQHVRIKVLAASSTVLRPFDKSLQEEAIRQLTRAAQFPDSIDLPERFKLTELLLDSSVTKVGEKTISLNDGVDIPYGMAIWGAGNGPLPLTLDLVDSLGPEQQAQQDIARGRLAVDMWLRVIGSNGEILALGDCTCITSDELPATAQVASQQGEYVAGLLNKKFDLSPTRSEGGIFPPPKRDPARTESSVSDLIASFAVNNIEYAKPFQFLNLGMLAYTGNGSALAQVTPSPNSAPLTGTGLLGNFVWRSVYLSKQLSLRNGLLIVNDWTKQKLFGRNVDKL